MVAPSDFWARLSHVAHSWPTVSKSHQHHKTVHVSFPPLQLAMPTDFPTFLDALSLSPEVRHKAALKLKEIVADIRTIHLDSYNKAGHQYVELNRKNPAFSASRHLSVVDAIRSTHEASFIKQLAEVREEYISSYQRIHQSPTERKRTPFNQEYTPLLEKYFDHNPYPSAGDREWLAHKTMMSTRQIEVWFQNHRRRARSEGRVVEKPKNITIPVERALEEMHREMPPLVAVTKKETVLEVESNLSTPECKPIAPLPSISPDPNRSCLDNISAPSHAFPANYPSFLIDEAFPCRKAVTAFARPVWYRTPAARAPVHPNFTVSELCDSFSSSLHIFDSKSREEPSVPLQPWYSSRCTRASPAPHPALVRTNSSLLPTSTKQRRQSSSRSKNTENQPQANNALRSSPLPRRKAVINRVPSNSSISSRSSSNGTDSEVETPDNSPSTFGRLELPAVHDQYFPYSYPSPDNSQDGQHFIAYINAYGKGFPTWPYPAPLAGSFADR
ncbi:homeobox-domain-containing protein [Coprinopsis marcescibilis]|uniref:Homeobox-domain-containing protein n=1 Tax=Coprinopsis marcescibilis TaxID=230819 RepID=A0A5C3LDY8_COPMA|nr:homeobox-domain-containing protein [Coprinopsis marcescibilis]